MIEIHSESWIKGGRTTVRQDGRVIGDLRGTSDWTAEAVIHGQRHHFAPPGRDFGPGLRVALWTGDPPGILADASHEKEERWEVRSGDGRIWGLRSTWRPSKFDLSIGNHSVGRVGLKAHTASCDLAADLMPVPVQFLVAYLVWSISMRRTEANQASLD